MVFSLMKFEQELHVLKAGIHMADEIGLHVVQPLVVVENGDRRHDQCNSERQNLGVVQLFLLLDDVQLMSLL